MDMTVKELHELVLGDLEWLSKTREMDAETLAAFEKVIGFYKDNPARDTK